MNSYMVTVTLLDGSRSSYQAKAEDGFEAVNDALARYGEEGIRRIAALHVRPGSVVEGKWVLPSFATPVVTVEGYRGKLVGSSQPSDYEAQMAERANLALRRQAES